MLFTKRSALLTVVCKQVAREENEGQLKNTEAELTRSKEEAKAAENELQRLDRSLAAINQQLRVDTRSSCLTSTTCMHCSLQGLDSQVVMLTRH